MRKLNQMLQKLEILIGTSLLGVLFAVIVANVFSRYILHKPFSWSDELSAFMFTWAGYLACAYTMGEDSHIRLTIVESRIPYEIKQYIRLIMDVIIAVIFVWFTVPVLELLPKLTKSPAMRLPLKYVYLILPIAFVLFGLHSICNIYRRLSNIRHFKESGEKLDEGY